MIFREISAEYKKIAVLLIASNLLTFTTTSSKVVVEFFRTPFTNKENIIDIRQDIKNLSSKVDTLIVTTAILERCLREGVDLESSAPFSESLAEKDFLEQKIASN